MEDIRIQVIFREETSHGAYQDALWFSQAEYDALTPETLAAMKQARIDNWIKVVTTPAPEPTAEELASRKQSEIDMLTIRLQELKAGV